jgi:hypothetical protein
MEPAIRRPAPGPLSRAESVPLPVLAKGSSAQGPVVKPTDSTGEQAASIFRQISYDKFGAAYAGVVAGRPVKGETDGVDPRHLSPLKEGPPTSVKERGTRRRPAELLLCPSPPEVRRTSRWAPVLTDSWPITLPHR